MLTPETPDKKADIQKFLDERMVAVGPRASIRELRAKSKEYVKRHKANDSTLIKLRGVTAMEFCAQDLVYLATTTEKAVLEVPLTFGDFTVGGDILRRFPFPEGEQCIPGSLCLTGGKLFFTNLSIGGGVSVLDLETGQQSTVISNRDSSAPQGLAVIGSTIYFSDTKSKQIKSFQIPVDNTEPDIQAYAGNGIAERRYGLAGVASFGQSSSTVVEGKSLLVCDTGVNAVSLISSVKPLYLASQQYGKYSCRSIVC